MIVAGWKRTISLPALSGAIQTTLCLGNGTWGPTGPIHRSLSESCQFNFVGAGLNKTV
jgi:hypothetical protein